MCAVESGLLGTQCLSMAAYVNVTGSWKAVTASGCRSCWLCMKRLAVSSRGVSLPAPGVSVPCEHFQ